MTVKFKKALSAIEQHGALLVFPIKNSKEPKSLWNVLHPRSEMIWEWDDEGDNKVFELWHLREELAKSHKVVYSKWYKNRATFFSQETFLYLLAFLQTAVRENNLSRSSQEALECLKMDSPQSTKLLKENLSWQGKLMESHYNKSMKSLWESLHIVGVGEVHDSSFPSLSIASTATVFEDLYSDAQKLKKNEAQKYLISKLGPTNLFYLFALKLAAANEGK